MSRTIEIVGSGVTATARMMVANANPTAVHVFRTFVGVAPRAIARSASHPVAVVALAVTTYASAPMLAILSIEKWRSRTR